MSIQCRIGIHKWKYGCERVFENMPISQNYRECEVCGKKQILRGE